MAKIAFNKLGLDLNLNEVKEITLENGAIVEVRQFLPTFEILSLVKGVVQNSITDGKVDPALLDYVFDRAVIQAFTNISFTDKQLETDTVYDKILHSGLFDEIWDAIPKETTDALVQFINASVIATNNVLVATYNGLVSQNLSLEASKEFMGSLEKAKQD